MSNSFATMRRRLHPPLRLWNVALWLGSGTGVVSQTASAEDAFWSHTLLWYKSGDKLWSEAQIRSSFHSPVRLGRHVIEREHANKANDFPPTLHSLPSGSCLSSRAHTSLLSTVQCLLTSFTQRKAADLKWQHFLRKKANSVFSADDYMASGSFGH